MKDKEDGLWINVDDGEFFMYYNDTYMNSNFRFEPPVNGSKVVYEGETLWVPYEFL